MTSSPNILIACLFGIAVLTAAASAVFCTYRHQYKKKLYSLGRDEPSRLEMGQTDDAPPMLPPIEQHPPVYCVEDLHEPPPAYQAVFSRGSRPSPQELSALRRRMEKLKRRINNPRLDDCERAIRSSEISNLSEWIQRIEALRDCEAAAMESQQPTTLRMVGGSAEHRPRHSEHARVLYRETGWVGVGLPREIRPPLDENGDLINEEFEEHRFDQLRQEALRRLRLRTDQ
ncbi:hypothetical protein K4F52_008669 [Lecanicillium sp. MT-2017a]|nr:hypothetical protein K4F52_008669 [Lecanicillium sp. MT-2017a]